jgi:hypothetical protein
MKKFVVFLIPFIFFGCAVKEPIVSKSATIVFKTPKMKFYDKGFISNYGNYIHLQIFNVGQVILDLKIYKDEVCQGTLQCISSKEFNGKYLHHSYDSNFLYDLFSKKNIYHKNKEHKILIKVK